jgi:ribose transport system permease protein
MRVLAVFSSLSPRFLKLSNLANIVLQTSYLGIVSYGMSAILISGGDHVIRGGIDLSLANNMALSSTAMAVMTERGANIWTALAAGLAVSVSAGLVNAYAVVKLKIIPLLATLAVMYILQGVTILISNNQVHSITSPFFSAVANGSVLGVPAIVVIYLAVTALMLVLFNMSSHGNRAAAVGGNVAAALAAGVNVNFIIASSYVLASATAFISGVIATARLSGSVPGMGDTIFLDVILIGYMSAVFSKKAVPNIAGTLLGSLFVGILSNGFTMINVQTYWVYAFKGALILLSVAITTIKKGDESA